MSETVLLRIPEAAERLSMSKRFVYDEIRAGRLRAVKVGSVWRVEESAISDYVETLDSNQDHLKAMAS